MNESHEAPPEACGDRIADLYTQWDHACHEVGDHDEHRCSCGEVWPIAPWATGTLDPEEGI